MKPKIIFLLLLTSTMFLSGCWNYRDLETIAIATGLAIDIDEQTKDYIVTIELVNQQIGKEEAELKNQIIEATGNTIFDAIRNTIMKTGKKIFWGHCKVFIISEAVAKNGVIPVLDWSVRDNETRPDIWVLIAPNTAKEILKTPVEVNKIVSVYLDQMLNASQSVSKYIPTELVILVESLSNKTASILVPIVEKITEGDKQSLKIEGSAVLKQAKLVYLLNGEESKTALLIDNKLKGGILTPKTKIADKNIQITLDIIRCITKLQPVIEGNKIIMEINTVMDVGIAEVESSVNVIDKELRANLANATKELVETQIKDLVTKTQQNYATDIFDFGGAIQRTMPQYWKEIENNWDETYSTLEIRPNIQINIRASGSSRKPIQRED